MMSFPENIDHYLEQVGQVACEVESAVEEQLEFVAISCVRYKDGENFWRRFPYLGDARVLYRVYRFRVAKELVDSDRSVGPDDLVDLQQIYTSSKLVVAEILHDWKVEMDQLCLPVESRFPL
jgi:hypothetical protein